MIDDGEDIKAMCKVENKEIETIVWSTAWSAVGKCFMKNWTLKFDKTEFGEDCNNRMAIVLWCFIKYICHGSGECVPPKIFSEGMPPLTF